MKIRVSTDSPEICGICEVNKLHGYPDNDATLWAHARGEHVSPACRPELSTDDARTACRLGRTTQEDEAL